MLLRKNLWENPLLKKNRKRRVLIDRYFHLVEKEAIRNSTLDKQHPLHGRKLDTCPIWCEVDYSAGPRFSDLHPWGNSITDNSHPRFKT